MEKLKYFIHNITKKQIIIAILTLAVVVICIAGGIMYYNYQTKMKNVQEEQDDDTLEQEIVVNTWEEEKEPEAIEVIQQMRNISFSGTSIEKDLKIKMVDNNSQLVSGVAFKITVFPEGAEDKGKDYADEDMDGIIYIEGIDAGKYTVKLHEMENFTIAENPISVEVKAKIEYVKVDVADEIRKESQVNTKVEDTANKNVQEEQPIINTVPLLDSKVIMSTVEKEDVSTENFPQAFASETKQELTIGDTQVSLPTEVTLYSQGGENSISYMVSAYDGNARVAAIQNLTWSNSDEQVLSLTENSDKSVVLSALQNGIATITATISYFADTGEAKTEQIAFVVNVTDFTDDKTQLLDSKGNGLYLDDQAKQIATLKDYGAIDVFYGSPKYTGWQTLDGKVYYFDANYKPVTGEQVIGSLKYNFHEDGTLKETRETRGIDVSKWQGDIDWNAVATAGIDFVIIRVGYRGSATGALVEDSCFKTNIYGATKNGIKVGVYFFTQAITETEAVEEASMAIELVKGYHLDYPIFIDTEEAGGRADNLSRSERTKIVKAFCKTVQNGGYQAGIYASRSWYDDNLYADQLNEYFIWVAQYNTECNYTGKYDIWQYTDKGAIPGIKGNVDMNICYDGR